MDDTSLMIKRAECAERSALASLMEAAPPEVAGPLGIGLFVEPGVVAAFVGAVDALSLNRMVGLGMARPATRDGLARAVAAARSHGVKRVFVQLAPGAAPDDLRSWVAPPDGKPYNRWVRLWRSTATPLAAAPPSRLRTARIEVAEAAAFAGVVRRGFGMPEILEPWLASTVGRPGWQHYGVWDGTAMVATGALFMTDGTGWFGLAATLESHRGHGAQSALIQKRFEDARALGCDWVVAETAEQRRDHPAPSYRNLLRLGFSEGYVRENFVLSIPPA